MSACAKGDDTPRGLISAPDSTAPLIVSGLPAFDSVASAAHLTDAANLIRAAVEPRADEFRPRGGDAQLIRVSDASTDMAWVVIHPHRGSHKQSLSNGKVIARINASVDVPRLGLKAGWNFWTAEVSGGGLMRAIMTPAGSGPSTRINMYYSQHSGDFHGGAASRWVAYQPTATLAYTLEDAWGTCDPDGCCCTGKNCDA